jgi:tetratricopeptide (TPR) repeat protein
MAESTADPSPENAITLDRLVHSIDLAEGFALFFARCNTPALRSELILTATEQLAALGVGIVEVSFDDEPANVRERLAAALTAADKDAETPIPVEMPALLQPLAVAEPPAGYTAGVKRAVFVTGLECGIPYDQPNARVLAEFNLGRDLFPRDVPHPLVIWLPDYVVTAVARFAPDFWAWRSGVFEFATGEAERRAAFQQYSRENQSWYALLNLTPQARLLRRSKLESLLDDYRDLPNDERIARERMTVLSDLGHLCTSAQDFLGALPYFEQTLGIARQVDDKTKEAESLDDIGYIHNVLGEKRKALDFYEQALPLRRQMGDRSGEATTLHNIGQAYDALGDKRKALDFFEQALALLRQVGDRGGEATTLNNIGVVYSALGDKRKALDFYEQALPLQRQVGDRSGEATTLNNIGFVYNALGDKRKALDFYEQALPLRRQVGDRSGEASTLHNIGGVYSALGDKRKALDFYEQALPLQRQVGDRWGESITRYNMGMIYEDMGDLARAEEELKIVVELDAAIERPNLASDRAALERVRVKRAGKR